MTSTSNRRLHELTATEIASQVKSREISAADVALGFLARVEEVDAEIRAWVALDADYVSRQASRVDESAKLRGLLAGVPIGVKDIFNTEFYPTQKGSPAWENYRAGNDARAVTYLRQEGGIIFGKADTSEFAVHAGGRSRNPHHLLHVTGSSSGGSAVAVATGMVPAALGTQTGGSIIRPASWCGTYAMKPSFGLIPRTGVLKTTDTLDTVGFFGRSVSDLELLFETLRVHGSNFPIHERKLHAALHSIDGKWRIAYCRSQFQSSTPLYVQDRLEQLRAELSRVPGVEVVELPLPESTLRFYDVHRRIYHPDLGYYLKTEMERAPDKISPVLKGIFEDSKTIPPQDYPQALQEQAAMAADLERFFIEHRVDVLLVSSSNGSAPLEAEPKLHQDLNALWTMTWLPVINVPQFKCPKGLPFGMQVVGQKFSDYKLFALLKRLNDHGLIPLKSQIVNPPFASAP